jgi:hypothetical protein
MDNMEATLDKFDKLSLQYSSEINAS